MPTASPISTISGDPTDTRERIVAGAAAGNLTVTGIKAGDRLRSVTGLSGASAPLNLTAEFTVTADDTINNTGGTSSAGGWLIVKWVTRNAYLG